MKDLSKFKSIFNFNFKWKLYAGLFCIASKQDSKVSDFDSYPADENKLIRFMFKIRLFNSGIYQPQEC